jgi:hypothetical protein
MDLVIGDFRVDMEILITTASFPQILKTLKSGLQSYAKLL